MSKIDYKYKEDEILKEVAEYIDGTYSQHYAANQIEASEFIMDAGHGEGFFIGNILKYAQRYGKKGNRADARKDLMKVIHYAVMAIYNHDELDTKYWNENYDDLYSRKKDDELVYGTSSHDYASRIKIAGHTEYTLGDDYTIPKDYTTYDEEYPSY